MMNALTSLIENGLTSCFGGFGADTVAQPEVQCQLFPYQPHLRAQSRAELTYTPTSENPEDIVNELAMLLTGGRLNYYTREVLVKEVRESFEESKPFTESLKMAQRLMIMSPEFHSTGIVQPSLKERQGYTEQPPIDGQDYKGIVLLYLNGGMDGFNALVPHSDCKNGKGECCQLVSGSFLLHTDN